MMDSDWNFKSPTAASSVVRLLQRNVSAQELKSQGQCIGWFRTVSPAAGLALCPGRRKGLPCSPVSILRGGWGEVRHLSESRDVFTGLRQIKGGSLKGPPLGSSPGSRLHASCFLVGLLNHYCLRYVKTSRCILLLMQRISSFCSLTGHNSRSRALVASTSHV